MSLDFSVLNELEKEIVQLLSTGMTSKEIAKKLNKNVKTLSGYIHKVYKKLDVITGTNKSKRTVVAVAYIRYMQPCIMTKIPDEGLVAVSQGSAFSSKEYNF
jgi:DNA-binding NarL/FixJ family response regulator